jgi:hypothetical protein
MVELVDTQDLKSCDLKSRAGSIPALSTPNELNPCKSINYRGFLFHNTVLYTFLFTAFKIVSYANLRLGVVCLHVFYYILALKPRLTIYQCVPISFL